MANIPVERKGGTPWWTWLLALLAIIGLIWLIAALFNNEPEADLAEGEDLEGPGLVEEEGIEPGVAEGAITSFGELAVGANLVGREVNLDGMYVTALTGDSSFTIAPSPESEEIGLVILQGLNESEALPPPPTGRDGEYNIDEGDVVAIEGMISTFDASAPDYAQMEAADRERVMRSGIYINANSPDAVTVTEEGDAMEGEAMDEEM